MDKRTERPTQRRRAVVLAVGSGGDVAPMAAIAARLAQRGLATTLLAPQRYAALAAREGVAFQSIGADDVFAEVFDGPDVWHPRHGLAASWRYYGAALRSGLAILRQGWDAADTVLVGSTFAVAGRVAQEQSGFVGTTVHLSPAVMFSHERPPRWPDGTNPGRWPRGVRRAVAAAAERWLVDPVIGEQVNPVREGLGLPHQRRLFSRWIHSPHRVAWLFPEWFAAAAADWPPNGRFAGFPRLHSHAAELPDAVRCFLAAGDGPVVVVTAGTAVVARPRWVDTVAAFARRRGARVIVAAPAAGDLACAEPGVLHTPFVPFDRLLPQVQLLVHHGGIGTAVDALRAGVPQWLVPSAHDQPDNAARLARLGVAREFSTSPSEVALAAAWRDTIDHAVMHPALADIGRRLAREGDGADRVAEWVAGDALPEQAG